MWKPLNGHLTSLHLGVLEPRSRDFSYEMLRNSARRAISLSCLSSALWLTALPSFLRFDVRGGELFGFRFSTSASTNCVLREAI